MLDMRKSLLVVFGLIFSFLFNAVSLAVDTDAAETKITEEKVRAILKSMETAIIEGDVKGVTAHMAGDVVVKIHIPGPEGKEVITMDLKEYERHFEEGMKAAIDYSYLRKDLQIDIAPEGDTARVTSTVLESMTINNQVIKSITEETLVLELRRGRILITSAEGVILSLEIETEKVANFVDTFHSSDSPPPS
jgi:ketosteroid isomerase-like protein